HENEPQRPTTTSKIIQKVLPETETYIWQRKEPPQQLIEKIKDKETDAWLLFPADRPDLISRKKNFCGVNPGRNALIIIPDGTWKEVRKIVRKSPWLDQLPLLAFDPQTPSRYDLRRNPDADHLCTAETVVELLKLNNELNSAIELDRTVDLFIDGYKTSKRA
ncbi:tRNA-uridine aminocarboxypropyltransferase, partial [Neptuniibacter sp.]|uniref:tRNA-uridine aminocarboxypropyltransferase n=1 Tax=Neptuniibacter sp. TaxID=1962643 RepID=UPI002615FCF8